MALRVRVLEALDHAETQYSHFKAIAIAGMGLFTDAYDFLCIVPVMNLIGRIYYDDAGGLPGETPLPVLSATITIAFVGTAIGQLVFGVLGDRMGRRRVYGISLLLMVFGSFACGFSICRTRACVLTSLCAFRFVLGFGIGGDYPISATIMSEFANVQTRGAFIAAVFSMQGAGILASSVVTMALAASFERATKKSSITPLRTPEAADLLWRIILMLGAVPAALTCYWRMSMPETARYTAIVEGNVIQATDDMREELELPTIPEDDELEEVHDQLPPPTYSLLSHQFLKRHGLHLFACSIAWLLIDIAFYSSSLAQSIVYSQWLPKRQNMTAYQEAIKVARLQAILAVSFTIPGYWATVFLIDRVGRRKIQMFGFLFMALFLFSMAGPYDKYWSNGTNAWFIVLYGFTFFFANFGPNTTTFIVPAELFPARFRTTCHGISGAVGKVGAIIGTVGFLWASPDDDDGDKGGGSGHRMMYALIILGGICLVGAVVTYIFTPETKGTSLEENEGGETGGDHRNGDEDDQLQMNGWNTSERGATPLRSLSPCNGRGE